MMNRNARHVNAGTLVRKLNVQQIRYVMWFLLYVSELHAHQLLYVEKKFAETICLLKLTQES
jgi:hypothetical protein